MSTVGKQTAAPDSEKVMVEITIDGNKVTAEEGSSLFNAVKWTGVELPAMCYHYSFSPFGSCGLCLVEVEGKKNNVRACTAKVIEGMVVHTDTEKMAEARKKGVEKHLKTHPLDCPVCDKDGQCELQDMAYDLEVYDIKKGKRKEIPEDTRSIVLDFNMERCILCGQCINVCKEVQLVDALCFFKKDKKTHVGPHDQGPLYCEFCGDCLTVCPVGAIVSKFSKSTFKPWQLQKTKTTCSFCSDGCNITLETKNRDIIVVSSDLSYESKFGFDVEPGEGHGGICVRGRFGFKYVMSDQRLSKPLSKIDGELTAIPWFKALAEIGKRLNAIKGQYGGKAIAGLISGRCTNEAVYLFQRLMRGVLGTNNIDTAARYGHMNSILAMRKALKIGRSTVTHQELALSDIILMVGSNLTETNPITGLQVKKSFNEYGGKLLVADSSQTNIMKLATHPLQLALHSEPVFIRGLIKAVVMKGLTDLDFIEKHPVAFEALQNTVSKFSEEAIAEKTGLPWEKIVEAAELIAGSKRGILLWGEGIVAQKGAYENILCLIDLALITGLLRKEGGGLLPICEENNEQGAVDMGGVPEFLPGQVPFSSDAERQRFSSLWHAAQPDLTDGPTGLSLPEIIQAAHRGEIKALYLVGENPLGSLPASMKVREALEKIDLIIAQDPFLTDSGEVADFVLPAATFAEKEGTFTNVAGEVNRVSEAFYPRGEARPDWKIFSDLSKHLGQPIQYRSSEEIYQEIAQVIPGYFRGNKQTAQPDDYLNHDFSEKITDRYPLASVTKNPEAPFMLSLEQVLYHSGKLSTRDEGLMKIDSKAVLRIGEEEADTLNVKTGDPVILKSSLGQLEVLLEISPALPKGLVCFPLHFNDPPVKDLLACETDPETHVIYFKRGSVTLERSAAIDLKVIVNEQEDVRHSPEPEQA